LGKETGKTRAVWIPETLDELSEETRKKLGWSRSYLYKYALTALLERLSVLTSTVHQEGDPMQPPKETLEEEE